MARAQPAKMTAALGRVCLAAAIYARVCGSTTRWGVHLAEVPAEALCVYLVSSKVLRSPLLVY